MAKSHFSWSWRGSIFEVSFWDPSRTRFYRFLTTFGVHLGTLWNHFFNTFFDLIFRPPFEPKNKPVLAMEREARRKLKLCFINVLELANTHQQRYSRTAEIASTPQKKEHWFLCTACPHHLKIYQIFIKKWPQIWCFLGALRVPKSQFLGVHMSDSSSTGKRPTFYSKMVPKMDPKSRKMGVYFQHFFWCCSGTLFSWFCLQNRLQNGTQKIIFLTPLTLLKCDK